MIPVRPNEANEVTTKIWRKIRLGVHKDADSYRETLRKKGANISRWADRTLGTIDVSAVELAINLVRVSAAQLGFTKAARRGSIYARAFAAGLALCVPEIGPRLREKYIDQPIGEWLLVGMDPIPVQCSYPEFFVVERDDDGLLWLNSFWAISGHLWSPESQWVFTLPR